MSTATARTSYRELIAQVAEKARQVLPEGINGRLESAVRLVLAGDVVFNDEGSIEVGSASDPIKTYTLMGHACDCQDFEYGKAPDGWCQHRIAAGIQKRVNELLAQQAQDAALTAAATHDATTGDLVDVIPTVQCASQPQVVSLGEAPASCNVYVMIGGHKVQVTLRDTDEAHMLERLAALLQRYPAAPGGRDERDAAPPAQTPAVAEPPVCAYHGPMKASTKAPGTFFCTRKLADGSYCPSRFPEK